jgi:Carboxypeptidase regulatory-like domain/TonB dependent receptor-like, beta-barrel
MLRFVYKCLVRRFLVVSALLVVPVSAHAQDATITGTISDSTGGVLPGVTITAVHEASGNTFEAVTNDRGAFRMSARAGVYRVTAALPGFSTVMRTGLELLVGQQIVVNLQMALSTLQESVTVTEEAPLIDTTSSRMGGNIDPRQTQELPVNGRDWLALTTLAPGMRANAADQGPTTGERLGNREFQLNVDGQEVSVAQGGNRGQPRFSRDAIAEFQFLSSRFDATQGRSTGIQVNAITKSGANISAGSFSGYFRDDKFNAADFIAGNVLPYSNQQLSGAYGGPILRDRLHYFANYEYEREPLTQTFNTPYPRFNIQLTGPRRTDMAGLRLDYQLSSRSHLMTRSNIFNYTNPYELQSTQLGGHPATVENFRRHSDEIFVTLTRVLTNHALNEVKVGFNGHLYQSKNYTLRPDHPQAAAGIVYGHPRITFRGFQIGGNVRTPQNNSANVYQLRDDVTLSFNKGGRHDVKMGGEYLYAINAAFSCRYCMGSIDAQGGPVPANIEDLFPVWNDVSTWNLAAISPITRRYTFGNGQFRNALPEYNYAGWLQDDWAITSRLTLNLGLRYDVALNVWANHVGLPPIVEANRPNDTNDFQPRLGFVYSLTDRTVVRGGYGRYYGDLITGLAGQMNGQVNGAVVGVLNDGRADFAANPFNGPWPTREQLERTFCSTARTPTCVRRDTGEDFLAPPAKFTRMPYSHQASIGMQRQVASTMSVEADYVFTGGRDERSTDGRILNNINLSYDPVTGINYPFTDISRRPFPDWGVLAMNVMGGRSNYHALQTSFTKRLSQRWQASGTYTLGWLYDQSAPAVSGTTPVPFPVARDLGGEYSFGQTDQRQRATFNGIWQVGHGFQLSGLYFYGSGQRFNRTYGGDLRNCGQGCDRLRPDGTIVPRNAFVGDPLHRVDLRLQQRLKLAGRVSLDGILEAFNLFNHQNYGNYEVRESNDSYGKPIPILSLAYQPRMMQLGFRATF